MLRERIKSSAIIILIINLIFLTGQLWFDSSTTIGADTMRYIRTLPIVERIFPLQPEYSISKENLSRPRKFLINDGSLWMAYYNTDIGFSPIEERTSEIIKGFLSGDITASKKIDNTTWEAGLESLSIYVEYPVSFDAKMFCLIMGVDEDRAPTEISSLHDLIILPSSEESSICILVRDSADNDFYAYILSDRYKLPASDLSVYTNNNDGYYEPAFSTGLHLGEESKVSLSPLVLFSDSQPYTEVLLPHNLITESSRNRLLENFSFNPLSVTPYEDSDGASNYIANYATAKLYGDSFFEYSSVSDDRGILLDESGDAYNVLNASIDFAEKTWGCVSSEPLSILVTSDLSDYDSENAYTFKFDYYCNGRPVEIVLDEIPGRQKMTSAIEMTVKGGRLISYRQYMRSYNNVSVHMLSDTFVTALDDFVKVLDKEAKESVTINDIYIGYLDRGEVGEINAAWLAKTSDGKIYRYSAKEGNDELE